MTLRSMVLVAAGVVGCAFAAGEKPDVPGGDLSITLDDGRKVALHGDSTWSFFAKNIPDPKDDINFALNDNRVVLLRKDMTWSMLTADAAAKRVKIDLLEAAGIATVDKKTVTASTREATLQAIDKVANKVRTAVSNHKLTKETIYKCVKDNIAQNDVVTHITQGTEVKAEIALDAERIESIRQCLEEKLAAPPDAKGKKGAKGKAAKDSTAAAPKDSSQTKK